jgi:hypothetical protein
MENRRAIRFVLAAAACAALAGSPSMAQQETAGAGGEASVGGGSVTKGGSDSRSGDTGLRGDGGASDNRRRDDGASNRPVTARSGKESGIDASRQGRNGPIGTRGGGTGGPTLSHGIDLITPGDGYAGLHRRAIRTTLIANAAKKPAGMVPSIGANPQFAHPGADSHIVHNSVGVVVPGSHNVEAPGAGHNTPGFMAHVETGTRAGTSGIVVHSAPLTMGPALHTAGINGTTIGHGASGPGSVGGPSMNRSGINGTALRPKH